MALTHSQPIIPSRIAPDFSLKGVDGKSYSLKDFSGKKALVVIFMCNHCPYVIAVQGRINQLAKDYAARGVQVVGINSNDVIEYPEDSFEKMQERAKEQGFVFPYLLDETQAVARNYGAVCTPDFFVFAPQGIDWAEAYRGRLDDNWKDESKVTRRELRDALDSILQSRPVNPDQPTSMGCNIKWI